jgi:antitoxin component of MazEF toxin-antitoxin module
MIVTTEKMVSLTSELPTKAAKIRALAEAGVPRADIARFLDIRYQHVRNVLVATQHQPASEPGKAQPPEPKDQPGKVRIGPEGEVRIPEIVLQRLGLSEGHSLFVEVVEGEIHLLSVTAAVRRAQAKIREFIPEGISLVDELLQDRRREAEGDE